jgi:hypothetical protein
MTVALADRPHARVTPPVFSATTGLQRSEPDGGQLEVAVRLAALLARPVAYIDESHCRLAQFPADRIKAIAAHRSFRAPVNRAVADSIGFTTVAIDGAMLERLTSSRSSRLAGTVVTAAMEEVRQVAWTLAAAVLSRRICGIVLRAHRGLAREILGAEGFDIATREVPVLYSALGELNATTGEEPLFVEGADATVERERVIALGLQALGCFLDASEPVLGELFSFRVSPSANYAERRQFVRPFGEIHCEQIVRFTRRRQPSWSATIG